jgi:hypothetical protein
MLRHVSDGQYLDAIRNAEKFILHVEVLFAAIDDLEYCFAARNLKGDHYHYLWLQVAHCKLLSRNVSRSGGPGPLQENCGSFHFASKAKQEPRGHDPGTSCSRNRASALPKGSH